MNNKENEVYGMRNYIKAFIRNFDFPLFFAYLILCLFGLVMIYSSSLVVAVGRYDFAPNHFFQKQVFNLAIAFPAFLFVSFFPYKNYKKKGIMAIAVVGMLTLLFSVHFFGYGKEQLGAQRLINIAGVNIQPSEIAKIVIIVYFASLFAKKYERGSIKSMNDLLGPPIIILIFSVGSIMAETDIGTSLIIVVGALSVIAASGMNREMLSTIMASKVNKKAFLKIVSIVSVIFVIVTFVVFLRWDSILTENRQGRILSFLNPFEYSQGSGNQVVNSYIAIGSGGVTGHGLGNSVQKMGYLPEPHTDAIIAIISEELGILGVFIVLGGLGFIVLRAFSIALKTQDPQARMLAAGIGSVIGMQTFVNIGGLTGIIPLTGIPLPFISYGGTSVILMSVAVGILMNVSMFVKYEKKK